MFKIKFYTKFLPYKFIFIAKLKKLKCKIYIIIKINILLKYMIKSIKTIFVDFNIFDIEREYSKYHYYEVFDINKEYDNKIFEKDYGFGLHKYQFELHKIYNEWASDCIEIVIAMEILSKEERIRLAKYCQCIYCQSNFIKQRFMCACCVGCLRTCLPYQDVINDARKKMSEPEPKRFICFVNY